MQFDIRAISLVKGVTADARIRVSDLIGTEIEFREGVRYSITLPSSAEAFAFLTEPERTLTALAGWARLYRYPEGPNELLHIIAPAEDSNGDLVFYRLDLMQEAKSRRGPKPAVVMSASAVMDFDACASWLIDLSDRWAANPDQGSRQRVMLRPGPLPPERIRVAWVGPELLSNIHMGHRLAAIGAVYGANILHVGPRGYRETKATLAGLSLDAAVVCRQFAPRIGAEAIPERIPENLIHFCDSTAREDLEQQLRTWIEVCHEQFDNENLERANDEQQVLLAIMLRAMLSHSKIGPFNHCPKETVLKSVRARRLNVPVAEMILNQNSEIHQDTRQSDAIFLWKDHNDGRQYFLNSRRIEHIKTLV